jgi:hypothetical protein
LITYKNLFGCFSVESSNRASASELASNFLSTLKIEPEVYIKSEAPETAGDIKGKKVNLNKKVL